MEIAISYMQLTVVAISINSRNQIYFTIEAAEAPLHSQECDREHDMPPFFNKSPMQYKCICIHTL